MLHWGIVGTGAIASDFAAALSRSERCCAVDVVSSSPRKAQAFAKRFGLYGYAESLDEMLANPAVDAIYIATPHAAHRNQALASIAAGKHVLCEKPLTLDAASSECVIDAARRRGVFLMEGYMYRCHPLMREVLTRLADGIIGRIHHLKAQFGFDASGDRSGRLFDLALGGGSLLDVGGYPVSFARLLAGLVADLPFAEPLRVRGDLVFGPTGVDERALADLTFASGFTARVESAIAYDIGTAAVVYGDDGRLTVANPWLPGGQRDGLETSFSVFRSGRAPETVVVRTSESIYAIEAALVADTLPGTEAPWPAMSWADTLGNMRVLDRWRAGSDGSRSMADLREGSSHSRH